MNAFLACLVFGSKIWLCNFFTLIHILFNGIREAIPEKNILPFGHCPNNNPLHPLASIFRQTFTFLRCENVVFLHCLKLNENDNFDCRNWYSSSTDENMCPCFLGHLTLPPCPRSRYLELGHMCGVTQHTHPEYAICMVMVIYPLYWGPAGMSLFIIIGSCSSRDLNCSVQGLKKREEFKN